MLAFAVILGFALWRLRYWDGLWVDLIQPEDGTPYTRGVIGAAHALVGASVVVLLPDWAVPLAVARLAVGAGYWLIKERGDLKRGGDLRDGIEDAAFVWLGTYYGPWWWPLLILGAVWCVMLTGRK